jgi:hypothetical protein
MLLILQMAALLTSSARKGTLWDDELMENHGEYVQCNKDCAEFLKQGLITQHKLLIYSSS